MIPYPLYPARRQHVCDGLWEACWLGASVDTRTCHPSEFSWSDRLPVPGCFDATPRYAGARGVMAYRRWVRVTPGARGSLRCGGGGLSLQVIVDGTRLGFCNLPYSPFEVEVPPSQNEWRELVILADNRLTEDSTPVFREFYDFYGYGGIYRSIIWYEVDEWWLDRVQVRPRDLDGNVELSVSLKGNPPPQLTCRISFDNGPSQQHLLEIRDGVAKLRTKVTQPRVWSCADPQLHTCEVDANGELIRERFGIRTLAVSGRHILLNGDPIRLLGVNRHEAHPQHGPALPLSQLIDDAQLIQDMGCNFVRGSHYAQDQRFLDICDEMGILVWEETLGWGYNSEQWASSGFHAAQLEQATRMVRASANHPSVAIWAFLNEGASSNPDYQSLYQELARTIRNEDDSRLISVGSNQHPQKELHLNLVDVAGINLYPGWYGNIERGARPLDAIAPALRDRLAELERAGAGEKPVLISEIGAGAIYGWRDALAAHWSEEYQRDHLETVLREVLSSDHYAGLSIWQFCDCRTYSSSHAVGRPRAFNNKGIFDEYRRPKLARATVARMLTDGQKGTPQAGTQE